MQHTIFNALIDLHVYETRGTGILARPYVEYRAAMPDGAAFTGKDFSPAPHIKPVDGIAAALELLAYLCLQPGDTDEEYFEDYTSAQLAWSTSTACETMSDLLDEVIVLSEIEGVYGSARSGVDQNGCTWSTFEVDYFADQEDGTCSICERELSEGWLCLDDGSREVCSNHIYFADAEEAKAHGWTWIGDPV